MTRTIAVGKPLPDLTLHLAEGKTQKLKSLKGPLIIYFYPKDHTSGCTQEGMDFRDQHAKFRRLGATILGVSRDSTSSHEKFCAKLSLPFDLVSDADESLCKAFGVLKEKSLYGKKYIGIERSTFVFDAQGTLRHEFRGVKVPGHVAAVLDTLRELSSK